MIGTSFGNSASSGGAAFEFGNALSFDAVNDFVEHAGINITAEFSFSMWINPNTSSGNEIYNSSTAGGYLIARLSGNLATNPTGASFHYFDAFSASGVWVHLFLTRNSSDSITCYVNGVQSGTSGVKAGTIDLDILGSNKGVNLFADAIFDEYAIWNGTTGTAQNAIDLYNSGNGALASDIIASPTAYWRMNESGTDTTAIDETGNYNGTLNNFPTSGMWVAH